MGRRKHVLSWGRPPLREQKLVQNAVTKLVLRLSFMPVTACRKLLASSLGVSAGAQGRPLSLDGGALCAAKRVTEAMIVLIRASYQAADQADDQGACARHSCTNFGKQLGTIWPL